MYSLPYWIWRLSNLQKKCSLKEGQEYLEMHDSFLQERTLIWNDGILRTRPKIYEAVMQELPLLLSYCKSSQQHLIKTPLWNCKKVDFEKEQWSNKFTFKSKCMQFKNFYVGYLGKIFISCHNLLFFHSCYPHLSKLDVSLLKKKIKNSWWPDVPLEKDFARVATSGYQQPLTVTP